MNTQVKLQKEVISTQNQPSCKIYGNPNVNRQGEKSVKSKLW